MDEAPRQVEVRETTELGHEQSDAAIRPLAMFLGALASSLVVVGVLVWLFFDVLLATVNNAPAESRNTPAATEQPTQPQLQVSPRRDLEMLRQNEERVLHATEWIDHDRKIARIPVDDAMALIVERGLPMWPAAVEQPAVGSGTPRPAGTDRSGPEQPK
jgi:hypothetical protein